MGYSRFQIRIFLLALRLTCPSAPRQATPSVSVCRHNVGRILILPSSESKNCWRILSPAWSSGRRFGLSQIVGSNCAPCEALGDEGKREGEISIGDCAGLDYNAPLIYVLTCVYVLAAVVAILISVPREQRMDGKSKLASWNNLCASVYCQQFVGMRSELIDFVHKWSLMMISAERGNIVDTSRYHYSVNSIWQVPLNERHVVLLHCKDYSSCALVTRENRKSFTILIYNSVFNLSTKELAARDYGRSVSAAQYISPSIHTPMAGI
jgi:hypothetical protein